MDDEPIKVDSNWVRIDVEAIEFGDPVEDGSRPFRFRLSKDRYERLPDGGIRDIRTNWVYTPNAVSGMVSQMITAIAGKQMQQAPEQPELSKLLRDRAVAIAAALDNPNPAVELRSASADRLAELLGSKVSFAALCVDLVDSTRLQATNPDAYSRIVPLLLRELAEVIGLFDGVIVNFTGDGLVS